ncbi:MAG: sigma-54-dependent Fis family transcriptional regulator, partial [Desulfobacteraceae bacterium]|nr:sigma-54-dependent Fis family transcriptional regulator [Desulfobacteraceae bacterium]
LPKYLIESTLFGHTKGAFTGADSDNPGLLEMADKGTLFLDEVGELTLDIQKKLLRALQEKRFRPVGSKKEIKSNFRLVSATHRDLSDMVSKNQFREDLFFRMFSINIHLPPLKDRESDINIIADHHLSHIENACTMSQEFIEEIQMYNWPGNVRELINTIDQVCSDSGSSTTLFPHHLPAHIRAFNIKNKFNSPQKDDISIKKLPPITKKPNFNLNYKIYIEKTQHKFLLELLSATKGNLKEACKVSGLSRSQLYRLMRKHHLNRN